VPVPVDGTDKVTHLAAGNDFVCGIRDNDTVVCWGNNAVGQLGIGTTDTNVHLTPTPVKGLPSGTLVLGAGGDHACAAVNSAIYCWGANHHGELGMAAATSPTPTLVATAGPTVTSIVLGNSHLCFAEVNVSGSADVLCFGASNLGQTSASDGADHKTAVIVPGVSGGQLAAGGDTTCAGNIPQFGTGSDLRCWGDNGFGQLGTGSSAPFSASPAAACGGDCSGLGDFAVGATHACAIFRDGVKCWGNGSSQRLGFPMTGNVNAPGLGGSGVVDTGGTPYYIAAGLDQTCAVILTSQSLVRCWGDNSYGQLGIPRTTTASGPIAPHWGD